MTTSPKNKKHIARTWQSQSLNKTVSMSHQPNTEFFEDALEVIIMSITSEKHGREQRIENGANGSVNDKSRICDTNSN